MQYLIEVPLVLALELFEGFDNCIRFPVTIAAGKHPFPFRTRK